MRTYIEIYTNLIEVLPGNEVWTCLWEIVPSHFCKRSCLSLCHLIRSHPRLPLSQGERTLKIISRHSMLRWFSLEEWMPSAVRCSWVLLQVQPYNGLVGFPMVTSPLSLSSPDCLENSSLSTRSNLLSCMTFSTYGRGRKSHWRIIWIDSGRLW